jgi:DNA repair protein RadA/Sms
VCDPGADLAVALAVASAHAKRSLPHDLVAVGEIGLGGEVRQVPRLARRLAEAARLGFAQALGPVTTPDVSGIEVVRVSGVDEALATVSGTARRVA